MLTLRGVPFRHQQHHLLPLPNYCLVLPLSRLSTRAAEVSSAYKTLRIGQNASQAEIKAAYYKLSKELHPDVNKEQVRNFLKIFFHFQKKIQNLEKL